MSFLSPSFRAITWAASLALASMFAAGSYVAWSHDQDELRLTLARDAERTETAFNVALAGMEQQMLSLATLVASDPEVVRLMQAGRRAQLAEGGGAGGKEAAAVRMALLARVEPQWRRIQKDFAVRQLHFHFGPGDTSFLRVHTPEKFGDSMDGLRHIIMDVNRDGHPRSGFETGRVYSGIRGVVPVKAKTATGEEQLGVLEAGTSFDVQLEGLDRQLGAGFAVLLKKEHVDAAVWKDFKHLSGLEAEAGCRCFLEATSRPEIREWMKASRLPKLKDHPSVEFLDWQGKTYHLTRFVLRDYAGKLHPEREPVGSVLAWRDVGDLLARHQRAEWRLFAIFLLSYGVVQAVLILLLRRSRGEWQRQLDTATDSLRRLAAADAMQNRVLKGISEVQTAFISRSGRRNAFQALLSHLLDITGSDFGFVGEVRTDPQGVLYLTLRALHSQAGDVEDDIDIHDLDTLCAGALKSGEALLVNDPAIDPRPLGLPEALARQGGVSPPTAFLALPVKRGARLLALVGLANRPGGYGPAQIDALAPILAVLAQVLEAHHNDQARQEAVAEIERLSRHNELLLESAGDGICGVNLDGNTTFANRAALALLGYDQKSLLGDNQHRLIHHSHQDGRPHPEAECPINLTLKDGRARAGEDWFIRADGRGFPVHLTVTPMIEQGRQVGAVVVFADIAQRKAMEDELRRLATTDALTGIANRRHFIEQLAAELARVKRFGKPAALLMIDLDHFKRVNDSHGHGVGDLVLKHFASVIGDSLRRIDCFGRLGGEEFAVLLPGSEPQGARELAERLRQAAATSPTATEGGPVAVTISIGVTELDAGDLDPNHILARADRALYRAKENGRNRVELELVP